MAHRPSHALSFLLDNDASGTIISELPIPGLYTSVHNLVAHDYLTIQRRLENCFPIVSLDMANLVARAAEDLEDVDWTAADLRRQQRAALSAVTLTGWPHLIRIESNTS